MADSNGASENGASDNGASENKALLHVGVATTTVARDDLTLSVPVRRGDPTVLLLHGLAGYGGEWAALIGALPEDFGIIAPDQRGHGRSQADGSIDLAASRWVEDAIACIESSPAKRVTVVGQSMGGIVAMMLAAERPDLVHALVLIEAGLTPVGDDEVAGLQAWLDTWPPVFETKGAARRFFGKNERSTPAWVGGLVASDDGLRAAFDGPTMLAAIKELAGTDRSELWSRITVPTVVIRATQSALDDTDVQAMAAARPGAEMATIAGGHDLHLEEPEIVASVIARCAAEHEVEPDMGAPIIDTGDLSEEE